MKEFWRDYGELCKESGRFMKKHWKGCILLNVAILGAEMAYIFRGNIKDAIEEKFDKGDEAR